MRTFETAPGPPERYGKIVRDKATGKIGLVIENYATGSFPPDLILHLPEGQKLRADYYAPDATAEESAQFVAATKAAGIPLPDGIELPDSLFV